tara:strand:- start:306 stop:2459 length:2154 start_codon:yes stop_codon:yes gene_type:complete
MITTDTTAYEDRKLSFESFKNTQPKEPSGDVKKEYSVGCFQKSDWEFIHAELMKDGSLEDNIPTDKCECINDCLQSDIRGIYLLTETEATELRVNSKVDYVNINVDAYPGTYAENPDDLSTFNPTFRYTTAVWNQQDLTTTWAPSTPSATLLNRCSSQLYRATAKKNPWVTNGNPQNIFINKIEQFGTGKDVDVIVCDTDMWFGHIEFCNPSGITGIKQSDNTTAATTSGPSNYIGGNVLKSGFASSATTGVCDVLDLVLDAPYYIDPAWFEADAGNRLTTRWDGTKVPVESVARSWWSDASQRSAGFAGAGTVSSSSISSYTRATCNGSNTAKNSGGQTHGTPCASQSYGRQYGWAYNANKWFLNLYGVGSSGFESGFDMQKIFHQNKPNRSSDNTKNPTVSSNSWGRRFSTGTLGSSGYYYYRQGTTGSGGVQYTSWDMDGNTDGTGGTAPRFMTNRYSSGSQVQCEPVSGSPKTAAEEMTAAGVIFVVASGNHNQKQVKSDHPDYNNYFSSSNNTALSAATFFYGTDSLTYRNTLNRGGFPNAFTGTISVGALDDEFSSGKERKVNYSASGNYIDCYATSDLSFAAQRTGNYNRYDAYYTYDSTSSLISADGLFNGTSSACPIAAGILATKLEYNRTWTYTDIKNWFSSSVGVQDAADFYYGSESVTVNDSSWSDKNSIQGTDATIIWDVPVSSDKEIVISGSGFSISGNITIS